MNEFDTFLLRKNRLQRQGQGHHLQISRCRLEWGCGPPEYPDLGRKSVPERLPHRNRPQRRCKPGAQLQNTLPQDAGAVCPSRPCSKSSLPSVVCPGSLSRAFSGSSSAKPSPAPPSSGTLGSARQDRLPASGLPHLPEQFHFLKQLCEPGQCSRVLTMAIPLSSPLQVTSFLSLCLKAPCYCTHRLSGLSNTKHKPRQQRHHRAVRTWSYQHTAASH